MMTMTIVDRLPSDCIKVTDKDGNWGVFYDKAEDGSVFIAVPGSVQEIKDKSKKFRAPLIPISSDSLHCISEVAKIAEDNELGLVLVLSADGTRIGGIAC